MLSNWFTFLLYNFIKEHAAEHLFILYRALRQQINTGPRDAVTGLARYTLDAATLLKSDLLSRPIVSSPLLSNLTLLMSSAVFDLLT